MKVQCCSFICTGNNVFGASCSGSILQFGTKRRHGLSCAVQIYGIFCSLSQVTALLLKMPSLRRGIFCSLTLLYQNTPHDFHCFNSRARKACRGAFNILHTRISFPLRFSAVQDSPGTLRLFSVNAVFLFRPIIALNFTKHCGIMCLHKIAYTQGWYIGITAASQAVKAGSTPVPCSTS